MTLYAACAFEPDGVEVQLSDGSLLEIPAQLVHFDNDRGDALQGVWMQPELDGPLGAVVVLHGNGGLFTEPDRDDTKLEVAPQFADWSAMLTRRGYAVLLPSSYYSRGFWEWDDAPRDLDEVDRLVLRTHDAYGALRFVCSEQAVDCDRIALLGFSNGASATLMSMQDDLELLPRTAGLTPAAQRERFIEAHAFYPGCGLQGLLDDSPYFPTAPLRVYHAAFDPLLEHCPSRQAESSAEAQRRGVEDPMTVRVYDGADHGFDSSPDNQAELDAQDDARERALAALATALDP